MIKIEREASPEDTILDREKKEELKKLKELVEKGELTSKSFNSRLWLDDAVKGFLYNSQHGKCCYCERQRDQREMDVEHFRPKAQVEEDSKHPGYWWLAYEWDNLLISCKTCNQKYKKAQFPLKKEQDRAYKRDDDIEKEAPYLLNPLLENPEDFIEYDIGDIEDDIRKKALMIKAIGKCGKAEKTVNKLTGINSREVMEKRASKLGDYRAIVKIVNRVNKSEAEEDIERHTASDSEFSGFARFYFKKMLK